MNVEEAKQIIRGVSTDAIRAMVLREFGKRVENVYRYGKHAGDVHVTDEDCGWMELDEDEYVHIANLFTDKNDAIRRRLETAAQQPSAPPSASGDWGRGSGGSSEAHREA